MRSIWIAAFVSAILGVALVVALDGCGSGSGTADAGPVSCEVGDSCTPNQAACSRTCRTMGNPGTITCQCGTGALSGMLVCGACVENAPGTGGATGRGTGGATGRGTGGTTAAGGRNGRSATAAGGRVGRNGTGGATGSGGSTAIESCPANPPTGTCNARSTPICQTPCVNSLQLTCTCQSGNWACPPMPAACP
jgi:hypothetical protein